MVGSYYYSDKYGNYSSTITGKSNQENHLYGEGGNDLLKGGGYKDSLYGGDGNDTLYGYAGDDYLAGEAGSDVIHAGSGNDTVVAGIGDTINLNAGNDLVVVDGAANVTVTGGTGNDLISVRGDSSGVFKGDDDADRINIGRGYSTASVYGGNGDDAIVSDARGGYMSGGDGNDVIEASLADRVYAGAGNDRVVIGSFEQRELAVFYGGSGRDTFEFFVRQQEATIGDFAHGQDKIDLSYFHLSGMQDMRLLVINGDTLVEHYDRATNQTFELWLDNVTHVTADDFIF